ncbi:hypothetical protein [Mesorhizobium loti]|uniref:hypothetical protein n=1 Tax=Rhizobium loti TaxID=381 RepID=UPI0011B6F948|nr:hypothetical protein [Mesorhizobium loti]
MNVAELEPEAPEPDTMNAALADSSALAEGANRSTSPPSMRDSRSRRAVPASFLLRIFRPRHWRGRGPRPNNGSNEKRMI